MFTHSLSSGGFGLFCTPFASPVFPICRLEWLMFLNPVSEWAMLCWLPDFFCASAQRNLYFPGSWLENRLRSLQELHLIAGDVCSCLRMTRRNK